MKTKNHQNSQWVYERTKDLYKNLYITHSDKWEEKLPDVEKTSAAFIYFKKAYEAYLFEPVFAGSKLNCTPEAFIENASTNAAIAAQREYEKNYLNQ